MATTFEYSWMQEGPAFPGGPVSVEHEGIPDEELELLVRVREGTSRIDLLKHLGQQGWEVFQVDTKGETTRYHLRRRSENKPR